MNLEIKEIFLIVLILTILTVEPKSQHHHSFNDKFEVIGRESLKLERGLETNNYKIDNEVVTKICLTNNVFTISGSVLKLSDIPLKKDRQCEQETKIVELFATEKVIIDQDLIEVGEELYIVIVASTWEIVGIRKIVLDGAPGEAHNVSKAEKGTIEGNYLGARGKSGLPGGRGGSFYGIGKTFINGENLIISANGGNGSSGQDGGDGADGIDRHTYNTKEGISGLDKPWYRVKVRESDFNPLEISSLHYFVQGQNGTAGGRGGDGGVGGKGGEGGEIILIDLGNSEGSGIRISASNGSDGAAGDGGKGGNGGLNAKTVRFLYQSIQSWWFFGDAEETDNGAADDGANGKPGKSLLGLRSVYKENIEFDFVSAVNDFKFYARWYLFNSRNDTEFKNFFNLLNNDKEINDSYNTLGFYQEFFYLECLYFNFRSKDDLLPLLQSLKERVGDCSKDRKESEKTMVCSKILKDFLQDLSKRILDISYVRKAMDYFIKSLADEHEDLERLQSIIERRKEAKDRIIKRANILEARKSLEKSCVKIKNLVSRENQEKIDSDKENLDERIERSIREPDILKSNKERQEELKQKLVERFFLEWSEIMNLGLELMNPMISLSIMSFKHYSKLSSINSRSDLDLSRSLIPAELQETYQETQTKCKIYIQKRAEIIKAHQGFLEEKKKVANVHDALALDALSVLLGNLVKELTSLYWLEYDPLRREEEILLAEEQKLNGKINDISKYDVTLQAIQHLKLNSQKAQIFGVSYEKFFTDQPRGKVEQAVLELKDDLRIMNQKRGNIVEELFVSLKNVRIYMGLTNDTIHSIPSNDNSQKILGITKISVSLPLKIIISDLHGGFLRNSYKSDNDYLSKYLKPALDAIHNVDMEMFNFIFDNIVSGDLHSNTNNDRIAHRRQISNLYINSNKIVDQYRKTLTSFIQFSFPFGNDYFGSLDPNWKADNSSKTENSKLFRSIAELDVLQNAKIQEVERISTKMDECFKDKTLWHFKTKKFYDRESSLPSFYTWRNESHNKEITDLLSGKAVTLKSIAERKDFYAVKIKTIGIRFRCINKSLQKELQKNFKLYFKHHGDSHYRCKDYVYVIQSKSYDFVSENQFLDDSCCNYMSGYEYLLSPYATWTLKLEPLKRDSIRDFSVLEKFKGLVDLELIGQGAFLDRDIGKCNSDLEKFYKKEGATTEPEFIRHLEL